MSIAVNETIVRDFYQVYYARNREGFAGLMHPEFRFTSPYDDHIDQAAYFARCWEQGERLDDFTIEQVTAVNQFVFLHYSVTLKETKERMENVEIFTIEDDHVKDVRVFFGDNASLARTEKPHAA